MSFVSISSVYYDEFICVTCSRDMEQYFPGIDKKTRGAVKKVRMTFDDAHELLTGQGFELKNVTGGNGGGAGIVSVVHFYQSPTAR
mmetsp:Transcript_16091/g.27520  ORF Transcript_16091/g.27520 Transcript_16091/m.27520 type:complete len:86 (-) Transcript_16091:33-290(-)